MSKEPKSKFSLSKGDRITSISIIVIVVFILCIAAAFMAGANYKEKDNVAAAAYRQVEDCIIYNNQISVTSEICDEHTDCAENGFCFSEFGRCTYFELGVLN